MIVYFNYKGGFVLSLQIKQIRFYGRGNSKNYPEDLDIPALSSGAAFQEYTPILSLGVQSLPGTKIYINSSEYPVVIGYSGIYELKVDESAPIRSIYFGAESLSHINANSNGYLIVDILYDKEGG